MPPESQPRENLSPESPESTPPEPAAALPNRSLRRWVWAGGGTAILLVAGAVLMQIFRGSEGVAADVGRAGLSDAGGEQSSSERPRNLATVGDGVVTYEQVAEEAMARYGTEVLDQLINRTIIQQACVERGVSVSEAEVEQEITKLAQDYGLDRDGWLKMLQAERNITPLQYKRDIIWPMLALKKLAGTEVEITEKDVQMAFERDYGQKVKVRMIMMENSRRLDEVRDQAVQLRKAAGDDIGKAAAEFGKLARENSIEPTSKSLDGVVPPIRRHSGPQNANVENAAFALEKGEISGIIQMPSPGATRYVLLFCEGRTEPTVPAGKIDLVRDQIIARLKKEKVQNRVASVFSEIKQSTPVHNFLTNESTGTGNSQPDAGTAAAPATGAVPKTSAPPTSPIRPASASSARTPGPARR